ncbi:hypothetical protein D3C79_872210 [compost metagenome]
MQQHTAKQVQVEGVGNVRRTGIEIGDHHGHGRHHHIAGEVGQQLEKRQGHGEAEGSQWRDVDQGGKHDKTGQTEVSQPVCQKHRGAGSAKT